MLAAEAWLLSGLREMILNIYKTNTRRGAAWSMVSMHIFRVSVDLRDSRGYEVGLQRTWIMR
jgi:hypothetical protein